MHACSFTVPSQAIPYLLLQRTQYLTFPRRAWCGTLFRAANRLTGRPPTDYFGSVLFKPAVHIEGAIGRRRIVEAYSADMAGELASIAPHLPQPCLRVLDIGCGIAGIDLLLYRHLEGGLESLHLLDRTAVAPRVFYGFRSAGAFYNSLSVARRLLVSNGVPDDIIHTMEVGEDLRIPMEGPLDLVISLISWGFHYPVETYLEQAHALLRAGGRLILDVRKGQGGEQQIARRFSTVQAFETRAALRIVATK
jgi:SAM-dependent methyltransferase